MNSKLLLLTALVFFCTIAKAQYQIIYSFSSASNAYPDGSLTSDGNYLYGMTGHGGLSDSGFVFKIKPDGSDYSQIFDFGGANGSMPFQASFFYEAGFLYGKTHFGGQSSNCNKGCGVLFKVKPDGTGYNKLLDFDGLSNGSNPRGTFISEGNFLYAVAYGGGPNNFGLVFKIKPDGTGDTILHHFQNNPDGKLPCGTPVSDGTFLYGMTAQGGVNGLGMIYKIKPDGTGYSKLLDFDGAMYGAYPQGSLIYDGVYLYGMTPYGGGQGLGVVFKMKTDGTNFSKLFDFQGGSDGANPNADLTVYGNYLYGMTYKGGSANMGTVFKIGKDGNSYSKIIDFYGNSDGAFGYGSFTLVGSTLYGMTPTGGSGNTGTIFKIDVNEPNSIAEYAANNGVSVFPNPTSTQINVQTSKGLNNATITLYNVLGEIVREVKNVSRKNIIITRDNLPNGVYIITVVQDGEIISTKKISIVD